MFLSRLTLNPQNRQVRRDLGDCHEMHRTLMSAWPDVATAGGARRALGVLYRLEPARAGRGPVALVQSRERPDWSRLPAGYTQAVETKAIDGIYESLRAGARLRFRLLANATRSVAVSDGGRGQRVELTREADKLAWLVRQGEANGFRVTGGAQEPAVRILPTEKLTGRRGKSTGGASAVTIGAALFEGILEVDNPDLFRSAMANGVGRGKAYGCGLMSVAKAG